MRIHKCSSWAFCLARKTHLEQKRLARAIKLFRHFPGIRAISPENLRVHEKIRKRRLEFQKKRTMTILIAAFNSRKVSYMTLHIADKEQRGARGRRRTAVQRVETDTIAISGVDQLPIQGSRPRRQLF